ncbi:MAG: transcription elongation factor GreA [Nitrospirales bacterium]|nr:MAG: transcription elongation factor GreA [Nitrospirales bacterium]
MKIPMTQRGYDALKEELNRIRKEDRPRNIQAIAEAREHGDLRENAEYKAAKEEQQFIATRIAEIEYKLSEAEVIEVTPGPSETVVFGSTVQLTDIESNEEKQYRLVGLEEADLKTGSISVQSPIGRGLIGHRVGDIVEIKRPAGTVEYEIQKIWFEEI